MGFDRALAHVQLIGNFLIIRTPRNEFSNRSLPLGQLCGILVRLVFAAPTLRVITASRRTMSLGSQ